MLKQILIDFEQILGCTDSTHFESFQSNIPILVSYKTHTERKFVDTSLFASQFKDTDPHNINSDPLLSTSLAFVIASRF
jgi:hypothetical protein